MLKIKAKYRFLILFTFLFLEVNSQQVYLETGIENAYFKDYVNNKGANTLKLTYYKLFEFFIESGYKLDIYKNRLKWESGISYNKYKIITGFTTGKECVPLTYNLTSFGLKTGFNFAVINEPFFKIQVHSHLSHDWLITGTNAYNDVVNDIFNDNTFDKTFIRFHKGVSVEYIISDEIATYISFSTADSFREYNQDSNVEEKYTFVKSIYININDRTQN